MRKDAETENRLGEPTPAGTTARADAGLAGESRAREFGQSRGGAAIAVALAAGLMVVLSGCGSEESAGASDELGVAAPKVDVSLRAPVYSPNEDAVIALRQDGQRLVKLQTDVSAPIGEQQARATTRYEPLDSRAGENVVLEKTRRPDRIFVPAPRGQDGMLVLEPEGLGEVRTFDVGGRPARVAIDPPGRVLYALSEDGSTVTAVKVLQYERLAQVAVGGDEGSLIEAGAEDGFWVTKSDAVAFYRGSSYERQATTKLGATALATDASEPGRAYAGESGSGRLVALEPGSGGGLEVVAERDVGAEARYLESEEDRLYAATDDELVVLAADGLNPVASVDLAPALEKKSLGDARLSGLAVGERFVYLTLEGAPYVLLVEKP